MAAQDPQKLRELGERLDDAQRKRQRADERAPPSQSGAAARIGTELVAALLVGGASGWGLDWGFGRFGIHTKPVFLILMFVLGAVAGIRNVIRTANALNAGMAAKGLPSVTDDDEES